LFVVASTTNAHFVHKSTDGSLQTFHNTSNTIGVTTTRPRCVCVCVRVLVRHLHGPCIGCQAYCTHTTPPPPFCGMHFRVEDMMGQVLPGLDGPVPSAVSTWNGGRCGNATVAIHPAGFSLLPPPRASQPQRSPEALRAQLSRWHAEEQERGGFPFHPAPCALRRQRPCWMVLSHRTCFGN